MRDRIAVVIWLKNLDYQMFTALNNLAGHSKITDAIFVFFAEAIIFVLIALLILFFIKKRKRISVLVEMLVAAFLARAVFVSIIRLFFFRPRPFVDFPVNLLVAHDPTEGSFPSGHAAFMFALATMLFFEDKRWGYVYLFLALLSGAARVVVGVHYPLDIVGGALVGIFTALITKFVADYFLKRRTALKQPQ